MYDGNEVCGARATETAVRRPTGPAPMISTDFCAMTMNIRQGCVGQMGQECAQGGRLVRRTVREQDGSDGAEGENAGESAAGIALRGAVAATVTCGAALSTISSGGRILRRSAIKLTLLF